MKLAYFDLISGLSGDMTVGALLHLGFPLKKLKLELKSLHGIEYRIDVVKKLTYGIHATRFRVHTQDKDRERSWQEIRRLIQRSGLQAQVKDRGLAIFSRLAEAEGKIHRVKPENVRFHEIGSVDSIVDIIATAIGTHHLGIDSFAFSPIPLGRGIIQSRHGPLPVPAPATLELLKNHPIQWTHLHGETVTPTGAAIISTLGSYHGEPQSMIIDKIGYGAGERDFSERPNVVRILLGHKMPDWLQDDMLVIESNIDDTNPEIYDYVLARLFSAGARDVSLAPIQMKKNRPGTLLRIIAEPKDKDRLAEIVFRETSTIGVRYYPIKRIILKRTPSKLKTSFGTVNIKVIEEPGGEKRAAPEYDDLLKIARLKKIPLKRLYDVVQMNFDKIHPRRTPRGE